MSGLPKDNIKITISVKQVQSLQKFQQVFIILSAKFLLEILKTSIWLLKYKQIYLATNAKIGIMLQYLD